MNDLGTEFEIERNNKLKLLGKNRFINRRIRIEVAKKWVQRKISINYLDY